MENLSVMGQRSSVTGLTRTGITVPRINAETRFSLNNGGFCGEKPQA
jgi:hypothetical protein